MKKTIIIILLLALMAFCICLIIQGAYFERLNHDLQLEINGFVKDDVTMLNFAQDCAKTCCFAFGILGCVFCLSMLFFVAIEMDF